MHTFQVVKRVLYVKKIEITNNLRIREWEYSKCQSLNDRDINASINIMFGELKYCFDK